MNSASNCSGKEIAGWLKKEEIACERFLAWMNEGTYKVIARYGLVNYILKQVILTGFVRENHVRFDRRARARPGARINYSL